MNQNFESAGPSKRGHQAAKLILEPQYLTSVCNGISSEGSVSRFLCLMSHISCLMDCFSCLMDCLLSPKNHRIAPNPEVTQDPGWPQNHHENSSIFEPVSKATKAMKIGPKATQNHEKSTLESREIQFLRKLIFAIPPMQNACFPIPDTKFRPKHQQKK